MSGQGSVFVAPQEGRSAIGLSFDARSNLLFVAGGRTGQGYVYDGDTGASLAVYQFTTEASFVNDVIVTSDAAYFTDSSRPFLYRVPFLPDGTLEEGQPFEEIALGGDYTFVAGQFNANGIEATADGR